MSGCTEPQMLKRLHAILFTFLLSCNPFCRICLVMVIFCCHGADASPSPAPLKSSKNKLNEKSGISCIPHLEGTQKQPKITLCKITSTCTLAKNSDVDPLTFKKLVKDSQVSMSSTFVTKPSISI